MGVRLFSRRKTPCILQMENTDCGAVALAIILAYYRRFVSLDELRAQCGVSRDGVRPVHLIRTAQSHGLNTRVTHQSPEGLRALSYPLILLWKNRHFLVLEGFKGHKVYINDPSRGRYTLDWGDFTPGFSGITFEITRGEAFKTNKKPKHFRTQCHQIFRTERSSIYFLCLSSLLLMVPTLILPIFSKIYMDHYFVQERSDWLSTIGLIMILLMVAQFSLMYFQRTILRRFETKYAAVMAAYCIRKMMYLPMMFFSQRKAGELGSRLQVSDRLSESIAGPICSAGIGVIQLLAYLMLMFFYSHLLAGLVLLVILLHLGGFLFFQNKRLDAALTTKHNMRELTALTLSHLTNIQQIKATGNSPYFFDVWQQQLSRYLNAYHRSSLAHSIHSSLSIWIMSFGSIAILWVGALMCLNDTLTIGTLITCNTLFLSLSDPILQLLNFNHQRHQVQADFHRLMDLSQIKNNAVEKTTSPSYLMTSERSSGGRIEIINLTFGYSRLEKPLFHAFNLVIEPMSKVGIIGSSGSGKSTLAHLISGLYTPWSGFILIDGMPLDSVPKEKRSALMAVVSQEQFFFKGSVKDNLCLWDGHYSTDELLKATQAACIDELLSVQLTEGASNLSGGQRQRLELARALLVKPTILILDEATSALDPMTEQKINHNIYNYHATTIHIAHRFNTIKNADKIFILDKGQLIDSGSSKELLTKKSTAYLDLFYAMS